MANTTRHEWAKALTMRLPLTKFEAAFELLKQFDEREDLSRLWTEEECQQYAEAKKLSGEAVVNSLEVV